MRKSALEFSEEDGAIRVGFNRVFGIEQKEVAAILHGRPYDSLEDFLARRVHPAEPIYAEQRAAAGPGDHTLPPIVEELKTQARELGLWNLFLPDLSGLSNLDYAHLAELTGRAVLVMHQTCAALAKRAKGQLLRPGMVAFLHGDGALRFKVRYTTVGGTDLTRAFVAGAYKLRVGMGECVRFRAVVRRTAAASDGDVRTFVVTARPAHVSALLDRVGAVARAVTPHGPCMPGGPGEPDVCP